MESRRIILFTPTTATKRTVITDVRTWGELKNHPEVQGYVGSGVVGAVKETKVELSNDAAVLPSTDCTIFLVQKKTKAGIDRDTIREKVMAVLEENMDIIADEIMETLAVDIPELQEDEDIEELAREAAEFE